MKRFDLFSRFAAGLLLLVLNFGFSAEEAFAGNAAAGRKVEVKGKVTDSATGRGVAGVVVSDGVQCTFTDRCGKYSLASDPHMVRNVFVEVPSGYDIPFRADNGLFSAYAAVDTTLRRNRIDFSLSPRKDPDAPYTMLLLGDPQVMSSRPHSGVSWEWVTRHLDEYRHGVEGDLYQILLGDMVVNEIEVPGRAEYFINTLADSHIRTLCIPGNHDHVRHVGDHYTAIGKYSEFFGPYNYAVNIGGIHYLFFDYKPYDEGIDEEAWQFIKADLALVPEGMPVFLCTHCPLTRTHGGKYPSVEAPHYKELIALLEGRDVVFWYGHIHFNSFWAYDDACLAKYAPGVKALSSNVVGRCGGSWACSGEIGRDGSPRGVVELKADGGRASWRYISLDPKYPDDFNLYVPGQFKGEGIADDNALYCNVYVWDEKWSLPELWVDGVCAGTFQWCREGGHDAVPDPMYSHFYPVWKAENVKGFRDEYPRPYDNSHLFKILPPEGVRCAEVRIRDRWGNVLSRKVEW